MSSDPHLHATLERILTSFHGQIDAAVRARADELAREAAQRGTSAVQAAERQEVEITAGQRLADDVRWLDESVSLGDVLERVTEAAARRADRAALLMVDDNRCRLWTATGFARHPPVDGSPLAPDDEGLLATAAREARVVQRTDPDGAPLPSFARATNARVAAAFPISVAGAVVAVLYVDSPAPADRQRPLAVTDIDILTRHAARMLEAITVQQAAGLRPLRVARVSQPPPSSADGIDDVTGTAGHRPFEDSQ